MLWTARDTSGGRTQTAPPRHPKTQAHSIPAPPVVVPGRRIVPPRQAMNSVGRVGPPINPDEVHVAIHETDHVLRVVENRSASFDQLRARCGERSMPGKGIERRGFHQQRGFGRLLDGTEFLSADAWR